MDRAESKTDSFIGFLSLIELDAKDGYLGAILVTDSQGVPQEFRCTHPVKPTIVQKSLYGETLFSHIGINLCGIPLIKAIQTKPAIILVKYDTFLPVRSASACPVAVVQRAGEAIDVRSDAEPNSLTKSRIESAIGRFQPIVIQSNKGETEIVHSILQTKFNNFDPLEPFERIVSAVKLLSKSDKRFQ